ISSRVSFPSLFVSNAIIRATMASALGRPPPGPPGGALFGACAAQTEASRPKPAASVQKGAMERIGFSLCAPLFDERLRALRSTAAAALVAGGSVLGSHSQDDVEASGKLADFRLRDRLEVDQDEFPVERIANLVQDHVRPVLWEAVDEDLRGQQISAAFVDFDVDVRRAAGIRNRLGSPEIILALAAGLEPAVPPER